MSDEIKAPVATVFSHRPQEVADRKKVQLLCRTDLVTAAIQTVGEGGETNLHSHRHFDGVWFVLAGRARFYTTDDEVIAELGPREGVLIPRHFPYWFERVGDEPLEILQVEASDRRMIKPEDMDGGRTDLATPRASLADDRAIFLATVESGD